MTNKNFVHKLVQISSKLSLTDDAAVINSFKMFRDDVKIIDNVSDFLKLSDADLTDNQSILITSKCQSKVLLLMANYLQSSIRDTEACKEVLTVIANQEPEVSWMSKILTKVKRIFTRTKKR
jgi:hypothetical protein